MQDGKAPPSIAPFGLAVAHLDDDLVAEVVNLTADQFAVLGLPDRLPAGPTTDPPTRRADE